jgi:hypothetical protein
MNWVSCGCKNYQHNIVYLIQQLNTSHNKEDKWQKNVSSKTARKNTIKYGTSFYGKKWSQTQLTKNDWLQFSLFALLIDWLMELVSWPGKILQTADYSRSTGTSKCLPINANGTHNFFTHDALSYAVGCKKSQCFIAARAMSHCAQGELRFFILNKMEWKNILLVTASTHILSLSCINNALYK